VNSAVQLRAATSFPIGIFLVNVSGCLAIGLFAGLVASGRLNVSDTARSFVVVGVLGGYTTFSSFSLDTMTLARGGQPSLALANALGQLVMGLAAVWVGFALASWRS